MHSKLATPLCSTWHPKDNWLHVSLDKLAAMGNQPSYYVQSLRMQTRLIYLPSNEEVEWLFSNLLASHVFDDLMHDTSTNLALGIKHSYMANYQLNPYISKPPASKFKNKELKNQCLSQYGNLSLHPQTYKINLDATNFLQTLTRMHKYHLNQGRQDCRL